MTKINYNRIKAALAEKGIPNKELADALKIAPETVSSWCTSTAQPSIKRLFDVATFLDVEAGELLVSWRKR
jgi:transcriptional regulator with XRE-family HTH domain